jgi:hypothetical protein
MLGKGIFTGGSLASSAIHGMMLYWIVVVFANMGHLIVLTFGVRMAASVSS